MILIELLKLAWRNIWRNRRRSYITMSSVAFAVFLSCLMMSVQYGSLDHMVDNAVKFYLGHIQIHNENYWDDRVIDNSLPYDVKFVNKLEAIPETQAFTPRIESFALSAFQSKTRGAMVLGIDPLREKGILDIESKVIDGSYFSEDDRSVLIGSGLAEYLEVSIGDSLILLSQGYHGSSAVGLYPISGIIKLPNPDQNNQLVCMPIKEAQWYYGLEDKVSSIAILVEKQDDVKVTKEKISNLTSTLSMNPMDWEEMMPDLVQTVKLKHSSSRIMIMILYVVIAFGMFGTFLMMTAERSREFGTTIAIGMHRSWQQITVFMEVVIMSLLGVLAGTALSIVVITYFYYNPVQLSSSMQEMYESYGVEAVIAFAFRPDIFVWQAWAIFIIGFVLSFYPIWVLQRINPVQAMRDN